MAFGHGRIFTPRLRFVRYGRKATERDRSSDDSPLANLQCATRLRNKPVRKRLIRYLINKRFSKRGQLTHLTFFKLAFIEGNFGLSGHPNSPPFFKIEHPQNASFTDAYAAGGRSC